MLTKFDLFCDGFITEGRKSDDKKKFKVNLDKAKSHIKDIGSKHHHYVHDKGHFEALVDELDPNSVYTPKSFIEHVKSTMKGKGKAQIADGYAKLLYTFLNDRVESPFEDYKPEPKNEEQPDSDYDKDLDGDGGYDYDLPDDPDLE
jgi:hypothetical protein